MRTLLLCLCTAVALSAQSNFEFWPGAAYDPAIPTFQKVLGFEPGSRHATHAELIRYLEALSAAAPNRLKVVEYGASWERRKLVYAVIGSEANMRRLPEIQASMKKLLDPRKTTEAEAQRLIANTPAIVWLGHAVHGNEVSGPDSGLLAAYHLLAARNQPAVATALANTIVLLDPLQNPDGRMRFIHSFEQALGLEPDAAPLAAERNEPWPGGRANHYLFDMNRDWFAVTQPETKARIKMFQEWYPVVVADLHEMGSETSYYFAPEAIPFNPHLTKEQKTSLDWFGRNNAKYFDQLGYSYFTREVFDAFFPGYGASWPAYYGSIAMTYENSSVRGLLYRRLDGTIYNFQDSIRKHFTTQIATAEAAGLNRAQLLKNFWEYNKTAVAEGKSESTKAYILPRRGDTAAVDKLAALLVEQGIEVQRAPASVNGFPDGSYVVSLAQPAKRFIRVLLDPHVDMESGFLKEQERRRARKLPDEIYDVTAWSLPLLYNVECVAATSPVTAPLQPFTPAAVPKPQAFAKASVAYVVPWKGRASARFLAAALRADLKVRTADKEFVQSGRVYPRGTLAVLTSENPANVYETVTRIAGEAEVVPFDTSWVDSGVNFGSRNVALFKKPRIALAWDRPVSSQSAGAARFVIERQFGYPVTALRTPALAAADLDHFDVIILPGAQGAYGGSISAATTAKLKAWVAKGGTLVAIEEGVGYLAANGLLSTAAESLATDKKPDPAKPAAGRLLKDEAAYLESIRPERETADAVQGILGIAQTDPDHWITAGVSPTVNAMVQGRTIYSPLKLDKGVNAAHFLAPEKLLASGYMWEENRKQLAFKPLVMVERQGVGHVIGFSFDPNFRAYLDGMNVLFLNAVFRGPAHSR
ncbi:MAG: peptidase M14 [Bryobacterales bacterium]|nr:peptidase M14 [Bryobacterales bacterium]